jgi:hypothetical protein
MCSFESASRRVVERSDMHLVVESSLLIMYTFTHVNTALSRSRTPQAAALRHAHRKIGKTVAEYIPACMLMSRHCL